jgi:PEP-CTERM motif
MLACGVVASMASAFGQGTIQFGNELRNNLGVVVFRAPIYGADPADPTRSVSGQSNLGLPAGTTVYGGPLLQGTGYTMALFAGPAGTTDLNSLLLVTTTTFRTANGDVLPAGLVVTRDVAIPGLAQGQIATLQIRVWDNEGGSITSWAQVLASSTTARGATPPFDSPALGGMGVPGADPPLMTGWTSFNISAVPEPSVIALGLLGVGAMLLRLRRR